MRYPKEKKNGAGGSLRKTSRFQRGLGARARSGEGESGRARHALYRPSEREERSVRRGRGGEA